VRQFHKLVTYLHGQLPRGHQYQGLGAAFGVMGLEPLKDGNHKGGRLAGARAGLSQNIDPRQGARNQPRLNRGGLQITGPLEGLQHGLR